MIPSSRYLFFGGKGGVGKTTTACATALYLLHRSRAGSQILLFSTDPAHSLSDSLQKKIGDRVVEVARRSSARLFAYEIEAKGAFEKFKAKHHHTLFEIASRGTFLDESDIQQLLDLSLPGMDEVMALLHLGELDDSGNYDRIIVDTAPSGHTTRLLRLPAVFTAWTRALDRLAEKHRYMVAHFARRAQEDEVDRLIRDLYRRIERVKNVLYGSNTAFVMVSTPEIMSVEETRRYFDFLSRDGLRVTDLIVNRVEQTHGRCEYCQARVRRQEPGLRRLRTEFSRLRSHEVPLLPQEVAGVRRLKEFGPLIWNGPAYAAGERANVAAALRAAQGRSQTGRYTESVAHRFSSVQFADRRLLIFGGKGGVGKTTAAAAAGLAIAEHNRRGRVLLFSTDPAHSLSDSFDEKIGNLKEGVAGLDTLDAMEIDPAERFEGLKERYRRWAEALVSGRKEGSWQIQFDHEAIQELFSLAPPGIDEIAALSVIVELLDRGSYSTFVLDMAPTGHLIRFLELPEIALSWVQTFMRFLLKYKELTRSTLERGESMFVDIGEELLTLSKNIKRITALLGDSRQCEFVGVAVPEKMSLMETERLIRRLKGLKTPMRRLLINNVIPAKAAEGCSFCAARRSMQEEILRNYVRKFRPKLQLLTAPQQPYEIRGRDHLMAHFTQWREL